LRVLGRNSDLKKTLSSFSHRNIKIVTAFASGTEGIVESLLGEGNKVDIVVGTINAFTSPSFIEHCASHDDKNLSIHVDFRYESSFHWKLYLVDPNIVIVGSANFTK